MSVRLHLIVPRILLLLVFNIEATKKTLFPLQTKSNLEYI